MNEPLNFTVKTNDGKDMNLNSYKGRTILIVNVASKCGLTPQYEGLEQLYQKFKGQGFEILAFPSNDFMGQEPGTDEEIKSFCSTKYNISFPLFSKIKVKGQEKSELYSYLTSKETNDGFEGEIEWNFQKFLVDKKGKVVKRYSPKLTPSEIEKEIESFL